MPRALCLYPPDVVPDSVAIPTNPLETILLVIHILGESSQYNGDGMDGIYSGGGASHTLEVNPHMKPHELIHHTLHLQSRKFGGRADASDFALKVVGREEYLLGDRPLYQFQVKDT